MNRIESEDFAGGDLSQAVPHFDRAVQSGILRENEDRLRFFTLWLHCSRLDNPAGALRSNMEAGRWYGSEPDEDAAMEYLRRLDGRERLSDPDDPDRPETDPTPIGDIAATIIQEASR